MPKKEPRLRRAQLETLEARPQAAAPLGRHGWALLQARRGRRRDAWKGAQRAADQGAGGDRANAGQDEQASEAHPVAEPASR